MAWSPDSWRQRPIAQQPAYDDPEGVQRALDTVHGLPPLVSSGEVDRLRDQMARVSRGEAFLLQGGDCAERFVDCTLEPIERKLKILLQMSLVLTWGARIPVVRVGRMAGQYAKPRSSETEVVDGQEMAVYRGDHVNDHAPGQASRRPDPERLVQAYFHSAATLNYARALIDGGFADLHQPDHWDLGFVRSPGTRVRYEAIVERLLDALAFVEAAGLEGQASLRTIELFTSHEGLLLPYETALTRSVDGRWYDLAAHMLWIGDRTRQLDGAHVEFFRGLENPVGVKVGPSMGASDLIALLDRLEPGDRPGRVTLITRFGPQVRDRLPDLLAAVQATGRRVVWACDPMHGNTTKTADGLKTRNFDAILEELRHTFDIHEESGQRLGGVHLELTGDDVTECTGGAQELSEKDLRRSYETWCDPRLNYAQSLEVALLVAEQLKRQGG